MLRGKIIYLLVLFILFQSCASSNLIQFEENSSKSKLEGWVFGSLSIINRRPIYNSYTIFYRNLETEERGHLSIDPEQIVKMKLVPDYFDEDKAVHLFAFKKPSGKYEFYKISFFQNSGKPLGLMNSLCRLR